MVQRPRPGNFLQVKFRTRLVRLVSNSVINKVNVREDREVIKGDDVCKAHEYKVDDFCYFFIFYHYNSGFDSVIFEFPLDLKSDKKKYSFKSDCSRVFYFDLVLVPLWF